MNTLSKAMWTSDKRRAGKKRKLSKKDIAGPRQTENTAANQFAFKATVTFRFFITLIHIPESGATANVFNNNNDTNNNNHSIHS